MGPAATPLLPLQAAPPTSADVPLDTAVAGAAVAGAAVAGVAVTGDPVVAAQTRISKAVLHLARELRRLRAHVGYIAFILFGLCKTCRPCAWEGENHINVLEVFAPWALPGCPNECLVAAIPCALIGRPAGMIECVPISDEVPLRRTGHYVAGLPVPPQSREPDAPITFEKYYASLGVMAVSTVCDGDCGLDVMTMMLGLPQSSENRTALRHEISDYFLARTGEPWMLDLLVAAQELDKADVDLCRSHGPLVPAPAVADPPAVAAEIAAPEAEQELTPVSEETMDAMQWASQLDSDASVLSLIRNLPQQVVDGQDVLHIESVLNPQSRTPVPRKATCEFRTFARFISECQCRCAFTGIVHALAFIPIRGCLIGP